jgi:transcription elongation GreA/GreB family factor
MIDKTHLRDTMLALTEAELAQAQKNYERFLSSARLDRTEPIESDEQSQAEAAADLAEAFDDREHEVEAKIAALTALDFGPKDKVEPGAVVRFGERFLVISVSTAEFECQGNKFIGISPAAPIYEALEDKAQGEDCEFRGRKLHIHELY